MRSPVRCALAPRSTLTYSLCVHPLAVLARFRKLEHACIGLPFPSVRALGVHEEAHFKWSKLKTIVVGSEHDKFVLALRKTRRDKEGFASLDGAPLPHDGVRPQPRQPISPTLIFWTPHTHTHTHTHTTHHTPHPPADCCGPRCRC